MPLFNYKAKRPDTQTVEGRISAENEEMAIELLTQQGLLPIKVLPVEDGAQGVLGTFADQVHRKDVYLFSKQLVSLLKGGVALLQALEILERQTKSRALKGVISKIVAAVRDGNSFSQAMSSFPKVFSPLFVAMVKVGEESGNLKDVLRNVTEYQQRQEELVNKVQGALIYPTIMSCVGMGTVIFVLTYVMPKIVGLLNGLNTELPWPTKMLLKLSGLFAGNNLWIVICVLMLGVILTWWSNLAKQDKLKSFISLKMPVVGDLLTRVDIARFCRTMEILLKGGIPILRSIALATPVVNNAILRQDLSQSLEALSSGDSLARSLQNSRWLPPMMLSLISVGEESGSLAEALGDVADIYESETNEWLKMMTTLLEPLMILVIGGVIGFLVMAMLLPIFQIDVFAR